MTIATEHDGDGAACEGHRDAPPVYNYGNWDEPTQSRMGTEHLPPADYCNVSCAYHTSDPVGAVQRIRRALASGKEVCAHPGLVIADGRRITREHVYAYALSQLGALRALVEAEGGVVARVKPHGMLAILLRDDPELMRAFLKAHIAVLGRMPFHGLAHTHHEAVAVEMGVPFVPEILKDVIEARRPRGVVATTAVASGAATPTSTQIHPRRTSATVGGSSERRAPSGSYTRQVHRSRSRPRFVRAVHRYAGLSVSEESGSLSARAASSASTPQPGSSRASTFECPASAMVLTTVVPGSKARAAPPRPPSMLQALRKLWGAKPLPDAATTDLGTAIAAVS